MGWGKKEEEEEEEVEEEEEEEVISIGELFQQFERETLIIFTYFTFFIFHL